MTSMPITMRRGLLGLLPREMYLVVISTQPSQIVAFNNTSEKPEHLVKFWSAIHEICHDLSSVKFDNMKNMLICFEAERELDEDQCHSDFK